MFTGRWRVTSEENKKKNGQLWWLVLFETSQVLPDMLSTWGGREIFLPASALNTIKTSGITCSIDYIIE